MSTGVLELAPRMPRTARWLTRAMAAISAVTALLSLTVSYPAGVAPAQVVAVIEVVVLIVISVHLLRRGYSPAALFLAAFALYFLGILLRVARNFTLLPPNLLTDNSFQISAIAHMVVMSLAIMYRYNSIREAAKQAQAETLRLNIKRAQELEKEVAERTRLLTGEIARRAQLETDLRRSLEVEKLCLGVSPVMPACCGSPCATCWRTPCAIHLRGWRCSSMRKGASTEASTSRLRTRDAAFRRTRFQDSSRNTSEVAAHNTNPALESGSS